MDEPSFRRLGLYASIAVVPPTAVSGVKEKRAREIEAKALERLAVHREIEALAEAASSSR